MKPCAHSSFTSPKKSLRGSLYAKCSNCNTSLIIKGETVRELLPRPRFVTVTFAVPGLPLPAQVETYDMLSTTDIATWRLNTQPPRCQLGLKQEISQQMLSEPDEWLAADNASFLGAEMAKNIRSSQR